MNNGTSFTCAADWECWCRSYGGGDSNPCDSNDESDGDTRVCPCKLWGGCGGGQWPVDSDSSVAVGRKSMKQAAVAAGEPVPASLVTLAAAAHVFSTTAGGDCDGLGNPAAPDGLCTWSAASMSSWVSADAECVEEFVVTAVKAAEAAAAEGAKGEQVDIAAAGEAALLEAFALGSSCRV